MPGKNEDRLQVLEARLDAAERELIAICDELGIGEFEYDDDPPRYLLRPERDALNATIRRLIEASEKVQPTRESVLRFLADVEAIKTQLESDRMDGFLRFYPEPNGLFPKYTIFNNDTGEPLEDAAFVLRFTDPAARTALLAYADAVEADNPELASDIREATTH